MYIFYTGGQLTVFCCRRLSTAIFFLKKGREDVTKVVHFGDPDREGELIVRLLLSHIGNTKSVYRMLTESILPEPIVEAYKNQKPISDYDYWYQEGMARQYMDWLFGINLTRYITVKTGVLFPVGRVLVPIVEYIHERDMKIKNFVKEYSLSVEGTVEKDGAVICTLRHEDLIFKTSEEKTAKSKLSELQNKPCIAKEINKKEKSMQPYKLFSGLALQSHLNKAYGIDMKTSMEAMQYLYNNGFITYPRTETEYVLDGEKENIRKIVQRLKWEGLAVEFNENKTIFDDSKCQGHTDLCITLKSSKAILRKKE